MRRSLKICIIFIVMKREHDTERRDVIITITAFYQTPNRKRMHAALNSQFHPLVFQYHTMMPYLATSELQIKRIHLHTGKLMRCT